MELQTEELISLGSTGGRLFLIILLGFIIFFVVKRGLKTLLALDYISRPIYAIAKNIIRWILITIILIIGLQQLGIKIGNIVAALLTVASLIAVGFIAVWSVMSNILCSGFLIISNSFEIGDEIEVVEPIGGSGLKGKVISFNLMFTTLAEQFEREGKTDTVLTQIPNNIFFQKALRRKQGTRTEGLGQHLLSKPLALSGNNHNDVESEADR